MTRKKALLEAALICSQYADGQCRYTVRRKVARMLADKIEALADSDLHYYPPGKPVIDLDQDSENSSL